MSLFQAFGSAVVPYTINVRHENRRPFRAADRPMRVVIVTSLCRPDTLTPGGGTWAGF